MSEGLYIPVLWLLFAFISIVVCHLSSAETVGFRYSVIRKHPECKPKSAIDFFTGRFYLRWKRANSFTRYWYRLCVFIIILFCCELIFLMEQIIFIRGSILDFFTWTYGGKDGILVIGFLPALVYLFVYIASKSIPDRLKESLVKTICPLMVVLITVGVLALVLLTMIWKLRTD